MLVSLGTPPGHLLTTSAYRNYRLEVEYRFRRSGQLRRARARVDRRARSTRLFPQSIEVQMMHENAGDFWCIKENIECPTWRSAARARKGRSGAGARATRGAS
jgi:hypothetical protein